MARIPAALMDPSRLLKTDSEGPAQRWPPSPPQGWLRGDREWSPDREPQSQSTRRRTRQALRRAQDRYGRQDPPAHAARWWGWCDRSDWRWAPRWEGRPPRSARAPPGAQAYEPRRVRARRSQLREPLPASAKGSSTDRARIDPSVHRFSAARSREHEPQPYATFRDR